MRRSVSPVTQSDPARFGPRLGKAFADFSVTAGVDDIQDWSSGDGSVGGDLGYVFMTFAAAFLGVGPGMGE